MEFADAVETHPWQALPVAAAMRFFDDGLQQT